MAIKPPISTDGKLSGYGPPTYMTKGGAVGAIYIDLETGIEYECIACTINDGYGFSNGEYAWKQRPLSPDWLATNVEVQKQITKAIGRLPTNTNTTTRFRISSSLPTLPFDNYDQPYSLLDSFTLSEVQAAGQDGTFLITDNTRCYAPLVSQKTNTGLDCIIMTGSEAVGTTSDDASMKWRCKFFAVHISTDTLTVYSMKLYSE